MVGILIKTMTIKGLYIGIIKDFIIDYDDNVVTVGVAWNDNDNTTEVFDHDDVVLDEYEYAFYDNQRWWSMSDYYYEFKRLLERTNASR